MSQYVPYTPSYSTAPAQAAYDASQAVSPYTGLQEELSRNEARIAEITAEISQLEAGIMNDDQLDRALAVNRADIGDMAGSQYHQGRISTRAYQKATLANTKAQQKEKEIEDLKAQIEQIDIDMPYNRDRQSREAMVAKRNRLQKRLAVLSGEDIDFNFKGYTPETPKAATGVPAQYEKYVEEDGMMLPDSAELFKVQNTDKNGNWLSQEAKDFYDGHFDPKTSADAATKKTGTNTKTKPEVDLKKAQAKKANQAAIKELTDMGIDEIKYLAKKGKSWKSSKGKDVTVEKTNGGYNIKCGTETVFVKG